MNCTNCGYLHFKITKKCPSCNTALKLGKSPFDIGMESGFTIFEGMSNNNGYASMDLEAVETATAVAESDYSEYGDYPDAPPMQDFDLDLSEAQSSNGSHPAPTGYFTDIGPDDFELDLSEAVAQQGVIATPMEGVESMETSPESVEGSFADARPTDVDDLGIETISDTEEMEVEGLGFNSDDPIPDLEVSPDELDLDLNVDPDVEIRDEMNEPEIDLEPEATAAEIEFATQEHSEATPEEEADIETILEEDMDYTTEPELELSLPEGEEPSLELSPEDEALGESEIALDELDEREIELDLEPDFSDEPTPTESAREEEPSGIDMGDLQLELEESDEEDDRKN